MIIMTTDISMMVMIDMITDNSSRMMMTDHNMMMAMIIYSHAVYQELCTNLDTINDSTST